MVFFELVKDVWESENRVGHPWNSGKTKLENSDISLEVGLG
jgi:hypothetical protein